ncbi:phage tail tip lysozyme [Nocardia paucivorans]|uniref:phage tail tip lysozyme n=1 Tax=Nocardia paucivorans TaxID=114259 RepID=UPI00031A5FC8|nr:phage tail tip lysozyme [Nocardia paucivorans]
MALEVKFPDVSGATVLNSYVDRVEWIFRGLAKGLGDGKAETVKPSVLKALADDDPATSPTPETKRPEQLGEGKLKEEYEAQSNQYQQYKEELDDLDKKVGDIASKAAVASNTAYTATDTFIKRTKEILGDVRPKSDFVDKEGRLNKQAWLKEQFRAMAAIDEELGIAKDKVSQAHTQLQDPDIPQPSPLQTMGGSSPLGGGSPYMPPVMPTSSTPWSGSPGTRGNGVQYTNAVQHASNVKPVGQGEKVPPELIYQRLREHGLTHAQAVGILGNLQVEAPGFDTGALYAEEGSYGLAQWRGSRLEGLYAFAANHPLKDPSRWEVQIDYLVHELNTNESKAYGYLRGASTPAQAAAVFDEYYERSSGVHRSDRIGYANGYDQYIRAYLQKQAQLNRNQPTQPPTQIQQQPTLDTSQMV